MPVLPRPPVRRCHLTHSGAHQIAQSVARGATGRILVELHRQGWRLVQVGEDRPND